MNDFEQEVRRLWDNGYSISEIAALHDVNEDEIENIIEDEANYSTLETE